MKNTLLKISFILIVITSCSSDDNSSGNNNLQNVNIKLEVLTSRNSDAIINRTINNETQIDEVDNLPYSFTYAQQDVSSGTFVKLSFIDNGFYLVDNTGSNWTDYNAELKISVDNEVVRLQNFTITEDSGTVEIDYTFQ